MKGFLKSSEGIFSLGPRVTTIGREGCDLIIQAMNIGCRHAVIEFDERERTFTLQDLTSTHGTFVNDVQVRNAAVPLSPGDFVRFGHPGVLFEFIVDIPKENSPCLPLELRPNYRATLQVPVPVFYKDGLPQLQSTWNEENQECGKGEDTGNEVGKELDPDEQPRWIFGSGEGCEEETMNLQEEAAETEKLIILHLKKEVRRLLVVESESMYKDDFIDQLKNEVAYLQVKIRQFQVGYREITGDDDLSPEKEICPRQLAKRASTSGTDIQLPLTEIQQPTSTETVSSADEVPVSKTAVVADLDVMKKELNTARGLVCMLQNNLASKDATLGKLAKEADIFRQNTSEKEELITALRNTVQSITDQNDLAEDLVQSKREVLQLQQKLNTALEKQTELMTTLESCKHDLQLSRKSAETDVSSARKLLAENESNKTKILDLERLERLAKVEVEQLSRRLEKLRSQLIQFGHLSAKSSGKISDEDLLQALKKDRSSHKGVSLDHLHQPEPGRLR